MAWQAAASLSLFNRVARRRLMHPLSISTRCIHNPNDIPALLSLCLRTLTAMRRAVHMMQRAAAAQSSSRVASMPLRLPRLSLPLAPPLSRPFLTARPLRQTPDQTHTDITSLELKMEATAARTQALLHELSREIGALQSRLAEVSTREQSGIKDVKQMEGSMYMLNSFFLLYIAGIATWYVESDLKQVGHELLSCRPDHASHRPCAVA